MVRPVRNVPLPHSAYPKPTPTTLTPHIHHITITPPPCVLFHPPCPAEERVRKIEIIAEKSLINIRKSNDSDSSSGGEGDDGDNDGNDTDNDRGVNWSDIESEEEGPLGTKQCALGQRTRQHTRTRCTQPQHQGKPTTDGRTRAGPFWTAFRATLRLPCTYRPDHRRSACTIA